MTGVTGRRMRGMPTELALGDRTGGRVSVLDILDLIEEADTVGSIVSISPRGVADGCCCALTVSRLLI